MAAIMLQVLHTLDICFERDRFRDAAFRDIALHLFTLIVHAISASMLSGMTDAAFRCLNAHGLFEDPVDSPMHC